MFGYIQPIFSISLHLFSSPAPRRARCPSSHTSGFKGAAFLTCLTSLLHFYTPHFFFFGVKLGFFFAFSFVKSFSLGLVSVHPHHTASLCLALPGNEGRPEWNTEVGNARRSRMNVHCHSAEIAVLKKKKK